MRYGTEPGTCEESALPDCLRLPFPRVIRRRKYPVGISLLGRPWDDRKLLEMAAAYERATQSSATATHGEVNYSASCSSSSQRRYAAANC